MIDPKIKEAWRDLNGFRGEGHPLLPLLDAYLDAEAGRRMAEHIPECLRCYTGEEQYKCDRHIWGLADWRRELERELDG